MATVELTTEQQNLVIFALDTEIDRQYSFIHNHNMDETFDREYYENELKTTQNLKSIFEVHHTVTLKA